MWLTQDGAEVPMRKLFFAGTIVLAAAAAIFTASLYTYSTYYATGIIGEKVVRYEVLGIKTLFRAPYNKRTAQIDGRPRTTRDNSVETEAIVIVGYSRPGHYTVSFSTNEPSCQAGSSKYELPERSEATIGADEISSLRATFLSRRYPDCVRMTITKDGVSESHVFKFSDFE
jgi:dienelactone hydrolase